MTRMDFSCVPHDKYGFPTYIVTGILMPSTQYVDLIRKYLHFIPMTLRFLVDVYIRKLGKWKKKIEMEVIKYGSVCK